MEAFGLVLTKAQAHGLPIVYSDLSGVREVVGSTGVAHTPGDPRSPAAEHRALPMSPAAERKGRTRSLSPVTATQRLRVDQSQMPEFNGA
ncbi:glycosyltransferase [Streptomyces sp. NPDC047813]|uniref:glycosyltransferase n=1 Tax=Streptomyces sp. NPDC047813 TaxID=3154608 RepID=UPI0033C1427D